MIRLVLLFLICCNVGAATLRRLPSSETVVPAVEHALAVDIESRPQLVAGEGLGVIARLTNVSNSPLYLNETSLTLTVPLEMEGVKRGVNGYPAYFPTELRPAKFGDTVEFFKGIIRLNPGDTYSAFWPSTSGRGESPLFGYILGQIESQFQFLFFTPGKYSLTLTTKYWSEPGFADTKYRTISKNVTVPVVAPLFVLLLGAAIGGLIAHFLIPHTITHPDPDEALLVRFGREGAAMLGSALLSVIVTIILSRVSDARFLVTVTVNDFWGAIVTGFVANYLGYKVLEKLIPQTPPPPPPDPASASTFENRTSDAA